jgi:O-antigen biosynthesis protein
MQPLALRAFNSLRKNGFRKTINRVFLGPTYSVEERYNFLKVPISSTNNVDQNVAANTINWFFRAYHGNSGGHINIMRFLRGLENLGYECRIVFTDGRWLGSVNKVRADLLAAIGPFEAQVYLHSDDVPACFAAIATGYETAFEVRNFQGSSKKFYFVQDYEPWFHSEGAKRQIAEDSYNLGLIGLTAGNWLAKKLNEEFFMETFPYGFACDKALYSNNPRERGITKRVFFYARPETERRGYELGILALAQLCSKRNDIEVIFAGSALKRERFSFPHLKLGAMKVAELGKIYNSCDLGLVLSFTNISLLPLELMACGTPVVSNGGPWVDWLLSPSFSKLSAPNVLALSAAMEEVLDNQSEWTRLHEAGLEVSRVANWDNEINKVAKALTQNGCHSNKA